MADTVLIERVGTHPTWLPGETRPCTAEPHTHASTRRLSKRKHVQSADYSLPPSIPRGHPDQRQLCTDMDRTTWSTRLSLLYHAAPACTRALLTTVALLPSYVPTYAIVQKRVSPTALCRTNHLSCFTAFRWYFWLIFTLSLYLQACVSHSSK